VEIENLQLRPSAKVMILGMGKKIQWHQNGKNLRFELPAEIGVTPAMVIRMQLIPEIDKRQKTNGGRMR
jgi:hypothetical protein